MNSPHLLEELHKGHEKGLKIAFKRYNHPLFYFAMQYLHDHEVAEEIVSDVFIKAWDLREKFKTESKLKAFLYIAVKNACLNYLRKPVVEISTDLEKDFFHLVDEDPEMLDKMIKTELIKTIYDEVSKLPEKQRKVFKLSFFEDMETDEISRRLGMSPTAVYANKSRAISALKVSFGVKSIAIFLLSIVSTSSP